MMNDQEMQFADPEWRPRQRQNGSYSELEPQPYNPRLINDDRPQPEQQQWEETPERVYKAQELPPYQTPPYQRPPVMGSQYQYGQARLRYKHSLWVWLIAVLIVLSMLGGAVGRFGESTSVSGFWHKGFPPPQHAQFGQTQAFPVGLQSTIIITDPGGSGDIQVQGGGEQDQVIVQADGQKPVVTGNADTLNINMSDSDVTVTVPDTANLVITAGDGDVTVDNISGQVTLTGGSGDITLQGDTLTGNSIIKSTDGDITFQGQLEANSGYQFISTGSGSVDLTLPPANAFSLTATTTNGSIDAHDFSSVQVQQTGSGATAHGDEGNAPRATLNITTDSGDISLSSR